MGWLPDYVVHMELAPTWAPVLGAAQCVFMRSVLQGPFHLPHLVSASFLSSRLGGPAGCHVPCWGRLGFPRGCSKKGERLWSNGVWRMHLALIMISLTCHGTRAAPRQPDMFLHLHLANQSHLLTQRHRASACSIRNSATCWTGSSSSMALLSLPCFCEQRLVPPASGGAGRGSPTRWMSRGPWSWKVSSVSGWYPRAKQTAATRARWVGWRGGRGVSLSRPRVGG